MKQGLKELGIFAAGINRFLARTGMTQTALAQKVGATKVCVSQWSTGKCEPKVSSLAALIKEGITAEEIFGKDIARVLLKNSSSARK